MAGSNTPLGWALLLYPLRRVCELRHGCSSWEQPCDALQGSELWANPGAALQGTQTVHKAWEKGTH